MVNFYYLCAHCLAWIRIGVASVQLRNFSHLIVSLRTFGDLVAITSASMGYRDPDNTIRELD